MSPHLQRAFRSALVACWMGCSSYANAAEQETQCGLGVRPMHLTLRHIEGRGIGYKDGYTTLEGFFAPDPETVGALPFVDLRGHVFDNGKYAGNAGLGIRWMRHSRVYGVNTYFDYRKTGRHRYSQAALGVETLGKRWDLRINGYLPVGDKQTRWSHRKFNRFQGHYLILKRKQEFAMKGLQGEVGGFLPDTLGLRWYSAAGPYYFEGKGRHALGGKLRLAGSYKDYISLEISGSYDNLFKGIVQGMLSFNLPFGTRSYVKRTPKREASSCSELIASQKRMVEPVIRDEIIVVDKRRREFTAINPSTGDPLYFIFVNNLNPNEGNGTFDNPYSVLEEAFIASEQNDIFYIYPGDGTTTGLADGPYQLLNGQQMLGAGINQQVEATAGLIEIPAQASGLPNLTATAFSSVLNVASGNTISGLSLTASGNFANCISINAGDIQNLTVINNSLQPIMSANGIYAATPSSNLSGNVFIANNAITVDPTGSGWGIYLQSLNGNAAYSIENNTLSGGSGEGIAVYAKGNSQVAALISGNQVTAFGYLMDVEALDTATLVCLTENNNASNASIEGLYFQTANQATGIFSLISNTCDNNNFSIDIESFNNSGLAGSVIDNAILNNVFEGIFVIASDASKTKYRVLSNTFTNNLLAGADIETNNTASLCLRFLDNQSPTADIYTLVFGGGVFNLEPPTGNTPTPSVGVGITPVAPNFCGQ